LSLTLVFIPLLSPQCHWEDQVACDREASEQKLDGPASPAEKLSKSGK